MTNVDCYFSDTKCTRLIGQLRQVEYSARRTHAATKMNEQTAKLYDGVKQEIKNETLKTKEAITDSKYLIQEETKHRKHSMEYEALSKLIETKPDRKLTAEKQKILKNEVEVLDVSTH